MPGCCIPFCVNSGKKGFQLFRIPSGQRNPLKRQMWLELMETINPTNHMRVCEVHFSNDQFEAKITDKKKLKPNAFPDLLMKKPKIEDNFDIKEEELILINEEIPVKIEIEDVNEFSEPITDQVFQTITNELCKKQVNELQQALGKVQRQCDLYKKQLENKKFGLKRIFTKDQLEYLQTGTRRGNSWSDETIDKGIKLYMACGPKGYEEILKQNLPYPSIRTVQRRARELKLQTDDNV